jgi:hypothetical protein
MQLSVNYQTTRRNNPEDSRIYICRCEKLKYYDIKVISKKRVLK